MLNLRFTAGVGVGFSGACAPPLVWRARKGRSLNLQGSVRRRQQDVHFGR